MLTIALSRYKAMDQLSPEQQRQLLELTKKQVLLVEQYAKESFQDYLFLLHRFVIYGMIETIAKMKGD